MDGVMDGVMDVRCIRSSYFIRDPGDRNPGRGKRRMEITAKHKGHIVFHKAGPSNIVLGLYDKFLKTWDIDRHG